MLLFEDGNNLLWPWPGNRVLGVEEVIATRLERYTVAAPIGMISLLARYSNAVSQTSSEKQLF